MKIDFLNYKSSQIEFRKHGNGDKLMIAFHGFSDKASLFDVLHPALEEHFTLIAVGLPYHGKTDWQEGNFSKDDIRAIIQIILQTEGKEKFSLMGYSMGGKITLNMVPLFIEQLEKVYLLAPDGIKTHPLYDVTKLPNWYMRFFKTMLKVPKLFFKLTDLMYRLRILSKFLYDFTVNHFSTQQQRDRFFYVSASIRSFAPDLPKVKQLLNQYQIPVSLFLGERDEVIRPTIGSIFSEGLANCQVYYLSKGHLLVDEDLNVVILEDLGKTPAKTCSDPLS